MDRTVALVATVRSTTQTSVCWDISSASSTSKWTSEYCQWTVKRLYLVHIRAGTAVRYSTRIKPISYLKANAAQVLEDLQEQRQPLIITQNGEAKAVIQDVASYEETQETLALLKILALGGEQVAQGKVKSVRDVVNRLRSTTAGD